MAFSANVAIVLGNLGKDVELKYTASGHAVATFSIATTFNRKVGEGWEEHTEWHNIKALGKPAEILAQNTKKGSKVHIIGSMHTDSWDDKKTGEKKYRSYILADQFVILTKLDKQTEPDAPDAPKETTTWDEAEPLNF